MEIYENVYIAVDLHNKNCVIGYMNEDGTYIAQVQVPTTAQNLVGQVVAIPAKRKLLTVEQGNLAFWAAKVLRDVVDELIVCDPRKNYLISRSCNKNDNLDTYRLCQLLRLDALKAVWTPKQMGKRRLFYHQIKEYQRLKSTLTSNKRQLQGTLRHWGYQVKLVKSDYNNPEPVLAQIREPALCTELAAKFDLIGLIARQKDRQQKRFQQTASAWWEIAEFQKMPGIGPIGAHTFSGYIQNPHRFSNRRQLFSFCQMAVLKHTSDGRRLRSERLSKAGHGCLKNVAHTAWHSAKSGDNEVSRFYQASLERCGKEVNARLNTQRKILNSLWSLWKNNDSYDPEKFFSGNGDSTR